MNDLKILHATIHGFGKWVDHTIEFSEATCIYGENESGKSTIQKFILFMLFGLAPKQRAFYRPKTSGKMGGTMTLLHPEVGEFRIERLDEVNNGAAVCFTENGETHDEAWLKERLNGMTVKTYESIFSFSALDLSDIRSMKDEDLGEVLLGIGMTGSNNIYSIEKKLDAKIGDLFKPSGKKPVMNQKIESLKRVSDALQSFREVEVSYREKKDTAAQLEQKLAKLQRDLKEENKFAFTIEKELHALPIIQEYHKFKKELENYPKVIQFPENGVERLEKWKELLLPLQSEWNVVTDHEKKYNQIIATLKLDLYAETIQMEADGILSEKQQILSRLNELKKLKLAISRHELQINEEVDRLQLGMQVDELASLELPFYLEKAWTKLKNETEQLKLEAEQLENEEKQLKQEKNYIDNQIKQLEDLLLSDSHVHELRDRLHAFKSNQLLRKLNEDAQNREKERSKEKQRTSNTLIGSIITAVLAGVGALITDYSWLYTVMLIVLVLGIGQWLMTKRNHKQFDSVLRAYRQQSSEHVTEEERREAEDLLDMQDKYKHELAAFQEQEKLGHIQYIKWNEKQNLFAERDRRLQQQIHNQFESYPFLKRLEIVYWPELYHHLRQVLKLIKDWQSHLDETAVIERQLANYHRRLDLFVEHAGISDEEETLEGKLEAIEEIVKMQQEKQKELTYYEQLIAELKEKQYEIGQSMQTYEIEMQRLFEIAAVDTEELFYEQARQYEEKHTLEMELEKTTAQLRNLLSVESYQQYTETIVTETALEMKRQQSESMQKSLEEQLETVRGNLADAKAELVAMESSESYSTSLHQYEMETEHFNQLAKEWAVLKTAKEMLTETKRNYRANYLSKVMEVTTLYFKEITAETYIQVYAPTESNPFQVESSDNIRYTVNELSQGTIDQLYVSLRLAISKIMSEKHGLPFIIDDAFVHFDANRIKKIIAILQQVAKKQQVVLFTCKQEIVSAVTEMKQIDITKKL